MERLAVLARQLALSNDGPDSRRPAPWISSKEQYESLYRRSIDDPTGFWAEQAQAFHWDTKWHPDHFRCNLDLRNGPVRVEWFAGGTTNICYNCLDRWVLGGRGEVPCFLFEGNDLGQDGRMTYREVLAEVCRLSNFLLSKGVKKGDAVTIYLPMLNELPMSMLACARIGAVHSVVFAGFSADSLAERMRDSGSRILLTASGIKRGSKPVNLKAIADKAIDSCSKSGHQVSHVLVLNCPEAPLGPSASWVQGRDLWWAEELPRQPAQCPPAWVDSEHPLFLLYTSGSTGKPKGVVHTTGGYMVGCGVTSRAVLDLQPGDVYWCSADAGWITGHSYLCYGPLLCGASCVLFGGTPQHPNPGRVWAVIEKYRVRTFYTAPTLLRSCLQHGDDWVKKHDLSSLRLLGTVGEPINEHAWHWYHEVVGHKRCPIVDTWWQTETGTHMITPLPAPWCKLKPGAASLPMFGVLPVLVTSEGAEVEGPGEGILAIKGAWPSMARTLHNDHARFESTYFAPFKGLYFTGDGARRDEDGYLWITGRVDDVINVSGHRISTAEVESCLTDHAECAEAAVIGVEHAIKGQAVYAYVTLTDASRHDHPNASNVRKALVEHVRQAIGPFAVPDVIHWAPALPKTRSGKIMRRVLRKIAMHQEKELGDVSSLAEPAVVEMLIQLRGK